ncbi:MAG: ABC transporter ATP-binding protein [Rhizobiaceae bacterium]
MKPSSDPAGRRAGHGDTPPLLELRGITKTFGDVTANRGVDFTLGAGEVVGLLGENGAGKTTLMNIAFGLYRPDAGTIRIDGKAVNLRSTADSIELGLNMVHQHAHSVPTHTVLENLMVGLPAHNGFLDRRRATARLEQIRQAYGLHLDPHRPVSTLAVGEKQRLDIIRALYRKVKVLIFDEPTSVLTPQETQGLFAAIRALQADGVGIVYISHKLNEVREITSRVVVMRAGEVVADRRNDGALTNAGLATLMCGEEPERIARKNHERGEVRLEVANLRLHAAGGRHKGADPIDFALHAGEIVGLAGVSGNGQVRFAEILAGVERAGSGEIRVDGKLVAAPSPRRMQALGVAYIPEDRIGVGLVGALSTGENLVISRFGDEPFSRLGWLRLSAIRDFAARQIADYDVRPANPDIAVSLLSGGNQQKVIVARELSWSPRILVIAQPTRGLDVNSAAFVHRALLRLREQNCAILLISDDLDEIFQLSDRIAVMYENTVVIDTPAETATTIGIGLAMTGAARQAVGQPA